ncbi:MAG: DNA polymerase III subunit alpha [Elusimicrobiota bacterium]|nr:DNA polymerase III subunit alpha [Elusimicrobiota bacterium]
MTIPFVHLHNHTEYSLLDGASRIVDDRGNPAELLKFVSSNKMPALAITDHGNMFGAIEFYSACHKVGIKPIIGCEIYLVERPSTFHSTYHPAQQPHPSTYPQQQETFHLTLLAKNNTGYENLMRIVTSGYLEGFYRKPRVYKENLKKYATKNDLGIICLSGCLHGEIPEVLTKGRDDGELRALKLIDEYKSIFGNENFYIELMNNDMREQKELLQKLINIAKKTNTPLVATNDCHYVREEDAFAHDVLLCIGTGAKLTDPKRLRFATNKFYCRTPQEMQILFSEIPEAITNTIKIAEMCNLELNFNQLLLPHYEVPSGEKPETYLRKLCEEGLKQRYEEGGMGGITDEIRNRLNYELEIVDKMGFATYFLIVADFVQYARSKNIPVGPGRGSGAGSLVAYALGITNICPIKYGLLFERFLNLDRRTMPDLDIDFADWGRDEVINYVKNRYGERNVAQIITFGTMQARLVIRDVARVLSFSVSDADRIAKLIPQGMTIYQALNSVKELKEMYHTDENIKKLIDIAQQLEGLKRHQGVHAAGLVIAKDEITKFTPLAKATHKHKAAQATEVITTQYNDDSLVKLGLLKIDFLGLRTLTVIEETEKLINKIAGTEGMGKFDIEEIPLDDKKTFKLLQEAKTTGVFQLESAGMKDLLRKLKPTVFEDIIALISLYRPGPMGSGMLDEFVQRKHQYKKIHYDHPILEDILKETYGIIVYQEQVMQIAQRLAGFSASQADVLRRAMGKKIPEEIKLQKTAFVESAKKRKIDKKTAEKIFSLIESFGSYGFNKSHAAAYALIAYRTAYLKANYPIEYFCALLTSEIGRSAVVKEEESRLVNYIRELKENKIELLPPDVRKSDIYFSIEENKIRFALLAIKNVGEHAARNIVTVRAHTGPFKSLEDFCLRVDTRVVNKKVIESLIKAGAFDFLGYKDNIALPSYVRPKALLELEEFSSLRDKLQVGQETLFELPHQRSQIATVEPWAEHVVLGYEREVLGFYLSGHPLADYRDIIAQVSTHKLNQLSETTSEVVIGGMIVNVKRLVTKTKREEMAKFKLENFDGDIDVLVFPKTYSVVGKLIIPQALVAVKGRISSRDEKPTIIAEEVTPLDKYELKAIKEAQEIELIFSAAGIDDVFVDKLKSVLASHPGNTKVYMRVTSHTKEEVFIEIPHRVSLNEKLFSELSSLIGEDSWIIH